MEYRDIEKKRINQRIHEINISIADINDTIKKYKTHQVNREYFDNQVKKLTFSISELSTELEKAQNRLTLVNSGTLDSELAENAKTINKNVKHKESMTNDRKSKQHNLLKQQNTKPGKYVQDPDRKVYVNYAKEYAFFQKICDSIPDYMLKNLESMAGNKGYTWRGCWCFGDMPPEKGQPIMIFEKCKNEDLLIIHEMSENSYNIYHKYGKDKKYLVSSTPKKH